MKKITMFVAMMMLAVMVGSSSEAAAKVTHEQAMGKAISIMEEMFTILDTVSDEATAKKACTALDKVAVKAEALKKEMEALPDPSAEQKKALEEKFKPRIMALMPKMMGVSMKMQSLPEGARNDIQTAMNKIQAAMQ